MTGMMTAIVVREEDSNLAYEKSQRDYPLALFLN